jgi:hypothetical protein
MPVVCANRDFYLTHCDLENDPGRTEALGSVPLDCRPRSTSLSVRLVPRWSASPRSGGAPAAASRVASRRLNSGSATVVAVIVLIGGW